MKNFEEFTKVVCEEMAGLYTDCEITIQTVKKNNDQIYTGLVIRRGETNLAPTIYLEGYFGRYEQGAPMDEIIEHISTVYENHKSEQPFDIDFFRDWETVRQRVQYKLVNTKANEKLLKEIPHINYLDLSVVFFVPVDVGEGSIGSILIKNVHMGMWGVSTEVLMMAAEKNTKESSKTTVGDMSMMIMNLQFGQMPSADEIEPEDMS